MAKLSKAQHKVVDIFHRWERCQIVRFADHVSRRERFAIEYATNDGEYRTIYPNPRTINSLIRWGILVRDEAQNHYKLASEWQSK
jgi:hypothetical protein